MNVDRFRNPPAECRGKPFWSWNGELEESELLRQIDTFKAMGMGGYFCHSRVGLVTEYLGDEWFRLINACADYGEKIGLETWLYDEDRWPSGTAGGMVTETPEYRLHFLRMEIFRDDAFVWDGAGVACFTADVDGFSFSNKRRLSPGERSDGRSILLFTVEELAGNSFYNGNTYVDSMNPAAVGRFLELTHEKYAARCGDRLGGSIHGVFTDEPHHGAVMCGFSVDNREPWNLTPWTPALPAAFEKAFGHDLLDSLPELYLWKDGERVHPVKWQYMELLERLFLSVYMGMNRDWCAAHGLRLTGHLLHEDTLTAQTAMIGSIARAYEYMQNPGVDVLGNDNRLYWIVKQAASACRQLGKPTLLSELYAGSGWETRLENQKAMGDWQALFGVNRRCHHLSWYSMKGSAKRDYPASISGQSAWYPDYKLVEDYFSRLHVFMEEGQPVCGLLVLTPVESVWCLIYPRWADTLTIFDSEVMRIEQHYTETFYMLSGAKLDFDYGDEDFLARLGAVEEEEGTVYLRVGEMRYASVLVTGLLTIRGTTLTLLEEFAARGGRVVVAGEAPRYVDALPSARASALSAARVPWEKDAVLRAVDIAPPLAVTDAAGNTVESIYAQARRRDGGLAVFLLNTDWNEAHKDCRIVIDWEGDYACERWNARTGDTTRLAAGSGPVELRWDFEPDEELLLTVAPESAATAETPLSCDAETHRPAGPFAYRLEEPNVCPLTRVAYRVDGGDWSEPVDILEADRLVRERFGLEQRSGESLQPWFIAKRPTPVVCRLELRYDFDVETMPEALRVAVEAPESFTIRLNGQPALRPVPGERWVDAAFTVMEADAAELRPGRNQITLETDFTERVNLEALYLLGGFGVRAGDCPALTTLPPRLCAGDCGPQGLPYYGAALTYYMDPPLCEEGDRVFVRSGSMGGASCIRLHAGDGASTSCLWARPYEADITDILRPGRRLAVTCVLTRKNTFEPDTRIEQGLPADLGFAIGASSR